MGRQSAQLERSRSNSRLSIKDWPEADRPREKLYSQGAHALTDAELLAIVLRSGTGEQSALDMARDILEREHTLRNLGSKTVSELMRVPGVGIAKASEILAACEIGRRMQVETGSEKAVIRSPEDVARRMIPRLRDRRAEVFVVLVLDARNALTREIELTRGTLNASIVHPREVFKAAIDNVAASIVVVHNHPSGNPEPSREDIDITRQLSEAGRIIGIPLHDHIIIAGNSFTSFADRGLL